MTGFRQRLAASPVHVCPSVCRLYSSELAMHTCMSVVRASAVEQGFCYGWCPPAHHVGTNMHTGCNVLSWALLLAARAAVAVSTAEA